MQASALHDLQASLLDKDHPGPTYRMQESALHSHSLRTKDDLQASTCNGLLPNAFLQHRCLRRWLWRWLQQRLRLWLIESKPASFVMVDERCGN